MSSRVGRADSSSIRRFLAEHPVTSFLAMAFVANVSFSLTPFLTRRDLLPFDQAPYDWLSHIVGTAVPAFLVTGAMGGREAVRDFARRCLKWRVRPRWFVLALLGVPVATLLLSAAFFGTGPLKELADHWLLLFTLVLPHLALIIVFSNVAEEIGWTGFLLARLQQHHSPLVASALVTLPFALAHIPGWFVEFETNSEVLLITLVLLIPHLCSRVLAAWFYNGANQSVLIVGLFHCSFNVTSGAFARDVLGLNGEDTFSVTSIVVIIFAIVVVAITRGRLAYKPSPE